MPPHREPAATIAEQVPDLCSGWTVEDVHIGPIDHPTAVNRTAEGGQLKSVIVDKPGRRYWRPYAATGSHSAGAGRSAAGRGPALYAPPRPTLRDRCTAGHLVGSVRLTLAEVLSGWRLSRV